MATSLLRAAMWGGRSGLNRVTALVSDDPSLQTTVLAGFARLVLVGRDGTQLHEEIIHAGGWLRGTGNNARFTRIDGVELLGGILDRALDSSRLRAASEPVQARLAAAWPHARSNLQAAMKGAAQRPGLPDPCAGTPPRGGDRPDHRQPRSVRRQPPRRHHRGRARPGSSSSRLPSWISSDATGPPGSGG